MMSPKIFSVLAALVLAVASSTADAGALPTGVCYSPWHHASVSADVIQKDFAQVKTYFSGVRTYHAQFAGVNAIEQAAKAGMKISVGIQMGNAADIGKELDAACVGAKANPASVEAIYVGNENLKNGAFGSFSGAQLCGYITQLRTCIGNPSVKIGTVQRINEWISASDAPAVAAACDVIGVNIYPFFTPGSKSPIEKLKDQWKEINDKFPGGKVHITETGWPRGGAMQVAGNAPSKDTAASFLKDYAQWAKSQPTSYWFMMYDTKGNQPDYENFFGLADTSGVVQLAIPTGDGAATPAQTPAPVAQTPAPVAQTPAPVGQSPAPSATKPAENPVAPDATKPAAPAGTKPAENPAKQTDTSGNNNAKTPAPATDTSGNNNAKTPAPAAPVTQSPAGPSVPAATPAATKTSNGKKNKKDCHA